MRTLIILLGILLFGAREMRGQAEVTSQEKRNYSCQMVITDYLHKVSVDDRICEAYSEIYYIDNNREYNLFRFDVPGGVAYREYRVASKTTLISPFIKSFVVVIHARDARDAFFSYKCGSGDGSTTEKKYTINVNNTCSNRWFSENPTGDQVYTNAVTFYYRLLPLLTLDREIINGSENILLPADDKVKLFAKAGFPPDVYHYQYLLPNTSTWLDVPENLYYADTVTFSARDLLGNNLENYTNQNIQFRAVSCYENNDYLSWSDAVSLKVVPSAPHITTVTCEMETCYGSADAKLNIQFDRELYEKERIYIAKRNNELAGNGAGSYTIDSNTHTVTLDNLPADTFDVRIYGVYDIPPTINTYSDGETHKYSIRIPQRSKVTYTIGQDSVHCFDGHDGRIWVNAKGGVGKYNAHLFAAHNPNDTLQTLALTENARNYFTELKAGNYVVHLTDTNACKPQLPDLFEQRIDVLQPINAVKINNIDFLEPLACGSADGEAWAYIVGGTGKNYTVVWKDSADMSHIFMPDPLRQEGERIKTHLKNLTKGKYYLYIYDENYPDVNPKTIENECGCMAVDSVRISEPPLLTVEVYEKHYITCNDDMDGVIVAHGTGGRPYIPADNKPFPYDYQWYKVTASGDYPFVLNDSILRDLRAGTYQVKMTDRNGIQQISQVFELVQPDVLHVTTQVLQHLLCDGEPIGKAEAFATGGTPPYTYHWTSGDTTKIVSGLAENIYTVFVRDARYNDNPTHYCSADALAEIKSPEGLQITENITEPTCNDSSDGKISLQVSGGKMPYSFRWNDGVSAQNRQNLPKGNYSIVVTDVNGCKISGSYTLNEPPAIAVNLGHDITLCKNQTISISGAITNADGSDVRYQWTDKGGHTLSTEKYLGVSKAGTYKLQITTSRGCTASDEINIAQSENELHSDFVMATKIPNNTLIYAVNIMRHLADSVRWILPDEAFVNENTPDRVQFSINKNGPYTIGLIAHKGGCNDVLYKTFDVVNESEIAKYDAEEPFLKNFVVYPNPNNGNFTVKVELSKQADYTLRLYSETGVLIGIKEIKDRMVEETPFTNTGAGSGIYFLHFICTGEQVASVHKILIQ